MCTHPGACPPFASLSVNVFGQFLGACLHLSTYLEWGTCVLSVPLCVIVPVYLCGSQKQQQLCAWAQCFWGQGREAGQASCWGLLPFLDWWST